MSMQNVRKFRICGLVLQVRNETECSQFVFLTFLGVHGFHRARGSPSVNAIFEITPCLVVMFRKLQMHGLVLQVRSETQCTKRSLLNLADMLWRDMQF